MLGKKQTAFAMRSGGIAVSWSRERVHEEAAADHGFFGML
jgi:hypothetical protein